MHVPEAAVDIDHLPQSAKDEVRGAGKGTHMQPVAVSERTHQPTHYDFRGRVLGLNRRHDARSLGFREGVQTTTLLHLNADARHADTTDPSCIVEFNKGSQLRDLALGGEPAQFCDVLTNESFDRRNDYSADV